MKFIYGTFAIFLSLLVFNCASDSTTTPMDDDGPIDPILSDEIVVYDADKFHNGLALLIENGQPNAYMVNKEGERLFTWTFDRNMGNDLELLPDGRVIGMFKVDSPQITAGGFGGIAAIVNPDMSVDWEFEYSSSDYIAHHDVELLPNGNVLIMVWERIDLVTAQQGGSQSAVDIIPEKLIEVDPSTDQIVWEWRAWDHIIQDVDNNLPNFGVIADNPQRVNINYVNNAAGDIMHANSIDYDADKDVIYMSVNFWNEVWVIDHSTTTAEAAGTTGGNYGKGGDLIYRFGNPLAYNNAQGTTMFNKNHFANLLEGGVPGTGNLLIYVNGESVEQSSVYELELPDTFDLQPNTDNEPQVAWSFTDPDMYFARLSGAVRLSNGNTLICEGDFGYWEVTPQGEVAWKYDATVNMWRGYGYDLDFEGLDDLGISF